MAPNKVLNERLMIAMMFGLTGTSFAYIIKQRLDGTDPSPEKRAEHFNKSFVGKAFIWVKERTSATKAAEIADINEQSSTEPEIHKPERLPLTFNNIPKLLAQSEDVRLVRNFGQTVVNFVTQVFNDPTRLRELGIARPPASRAATVNQTIDPETPK
eukprot:GILK01011791.1.p1 GENE.GILK01011791.1~~GILK01011791.1.p1  ORF type:complete len:170 (-),score=19.73 GILK01011791.1:115-585(-)